VIDPRLPPSLATLLGLRFEIESAVAILPGMSGASVYCCLARDGKRYALKQWPTSTSRDRIADVHRVLQFARDQGCSLLPKSFPLDAAAIETVWGQDDFWELAQWMPGTPAPADAALEIVATGAGAMAQFHRAAAPLGVKVQPPPAVLARLKRLAQLQTQLPAALRTDPGQLGSPPLVHAISQAQTMLRQNWGSISGQIDRVLRRHAAQAVPTQYVLRDIHREHLLFESYQPAGLIDFDAVRIDTPAADLARWTGSFMAGRLDGNSLWEAVLAGFLKESPSYNEVEAERLIRLASDLHFATAWLRLANWVVWLVAEHRRFPPGEQAIVSRILEGLLVCRHGSCRANESDRRSIV